MKRLRGIFALGAFAALLAATSALAAELPDASDPAVPASSASAPAVPAPTVSAPAPADTASPSEPGVEKGTTLAAPTQPATAPEPKSSGGTSAAAAPAPEEGAEEAEADEGVAPMPPPDQPFEIPAIPSSSCAGSGVPPVLIPIYQRAAAQ